MQALDVTHKNHPDNRFMHHNFMTVETVELMSAVVRLDVHPESLNPLGMIHGGALYTLADNATGAAAHGDGRWYVTQNSDMHFLRNQGNGVVRGYATVRHRGKSTCLVDVEIRNEEQAVLATGTFTFFCIKPEMTKGK